MAQSDVVVIGAGVIGLTLARELRRRGARVLVLERSEIGHGASTAAAGMLGALAEAEKAGPLFDLALAGRELSQSWVADLEAESGIECGYVSGAVVYCSCSEQDERVVSERMRWHSQRGIARIERLTAEDARAFVPGLGPAVRSALLYRDEHWLDPKRLIEALSLAVARLGVQVKTGAVGVRVSAAKGRVTGVESERERYEAPCVVNAAGCWAGLIELPGQAALPIEPARGQMVVLSSPGTRLEHVLYSPRGYVVPRDRGPVLAGSTFEQVGFEPGVTAEGVSGILGNAVSLLPALATSRLRDAWSGFRPVAPDGLPVLGQSAHAEGLWHAAGHGRHGIRLAAITGALIADAIEGKANDLLIPFSPARFGG